jgi:HTH-type transcriptional regulator/antitoxin HigA
MTTEGRIWPDSAIHPGETLAETLAARGMTQAELARRAGRPIQAINEIIKGSKEITAATALQLERVLGIPAHVWVRLEADYRINKARLEDEPRLEREIPQGRKYPYGEMAAWGWVPRVGGGLERVKHLLSFFAVSSLEHVANPIASFRLSPRVKVSSEAVVAWLRAGEIEGQKVPTKPYSATGLRQCLGEVRVMTTQAPETFVPRLRKVLGDSGVALAFVPHLKGTGAHGAARWLSPDKALVQVSIRYKWEDIFWFSVLHELGHLLLHGRKEVFINFDKDRTGLAEKEADEFASNELIPSDEYAHFLRRPLSEASIRRFAVEQGIAPSIVVGRLMHDDRLDWNQLSHVRRRFEWKEESQKDDAS